MKNPKKKQKDKKMHPIYSSSKIDLIVPYTEEADYIVDSDGDYGLNNVRFRYEFEQSPDGKHIVRPVSEINVYEREATFELLTREARRIARLFGYDLNTNRSMFREFFSIVYLWYVVTGYPLSHLEKLIRDGYFKSPVDVEEFLLLTDDFVDADEIVEYYSTTISERRIMNPEKPGVSFCDICEEGDDIDESDTDENEFCDFSDSDQNETIPDIILRYDREREWRLFERLHEIKRVLKTEADEETRTRLEEERKSIIAQIYRMREEFLAEHGLTYMDFVLWRREKQISRKWGWVKYPIDGEEEKTRLDMIEEMLLTKYETVKTMLESLIIQDAEYQKEDSEDPDEENEVHNPAARKEELIRLKEKLENSLRKVEFARLSPEEKKVLQIREIINRIYRLGKDRNKLAYRLTEQVKGKISKIRCRGTRQALFRTIDLVWRKRNERFKKLTWNVSKLQNSQKPVQLTLFQT